MQCQRKSSSRFFWQFFCLSFSLSLASFFLLLQFTAYLLLLLLLFDAHCVVIDVGAWFSMSVVIECFVPLSANTIRKKCMKKAHKKLHYSSFGFFFLRSFFYFRLFSFVTFSLVGFKLLHFKFSVCKKKKTYTHIWVQSRQAKKAREKKVQKKGKNIQY